MAELIIDTKKIRENIIMLSEFFSQHNKQWSLITKVFSGDKELIRTLLTPDVIEMIHSVGDSRLDSLRNLKEINPDMRTIYIRPPATNEVDDVIRYADISLNTSRETILALNESAKKQNKIHEVIVMIELGELREGVKRDSLMRFYEHVFDLPNIEIIGIGSNLGCMYGIEPTEDKLMQLALYKEMISEKFNKYLKFVSGGTSITLPKVEAGEVPGEVNHFRIGEAAFFGVSPLRNKRFRNLHVNTFELRANIIELEEKNIVPEGTVSDANIGDAIEFDKDKTDETSLKAILDVGLLDVDREGLEPTDSNVSFVGITSDMMVCDLGRHRSPGTAERYKVGDQMSFIPNYIAVARLLNSKFIKKELT